jgi:hypothetical protein
MSTSGMQSKVQCLVIYNLADYPFKLGCSWLRHHVAEISFSRKQVVLRKTNGQNVAINTLDALHSEIDESQLRFLGDSPSLPSVCHLLSINKVVQMSKRGEIADAFVFLLQSNTNDLVELNEDNTDIFSKLFPGNSDAEDQLKNFIKKHKDLFRTDYTSLKISHTLQMSFP